MARILLIKLGALGDVVIATSAMRAIQRAHRGDEIWFLTGTAFAGLFQDWPGLHVRPMERKGLLNLLRCAFWVRRQRFQRIYDLQSNDRSALICALSGASMRIGNQPRYPYTHHPSTWHRQDEPGYLRLNQMLAAAGISVAEEQPYLPVGEAERSRVTGWLREHALDDGRFAVMHAGASPRWPAKRWPHFAELAIQVEKSGVRVVWLGAGADRHVNAALAKLAGIDATEAFSVPALAEVARHARFAITNDSGPMHALAAAGIPIYALFGPTDWRRCHAMGQRDHALFNAAPCAACERKDRATATDHVCLAGISAQTVMSRLATDGLLPDRQLQNP